MNAVISQLPPLLIVVPILGALLALLLGKWNRSFAYPITLAMIGFQFAVSLVLMESVMDGEVIHYYLGGWPPPLGIELVIDSFNSFVLVVILALALLTAVWAREGADLDIVPEKRVSFFVVFQLLVTGLCGMAVTGDLFNLYVFLEISSIAAYTLVAAGRNPRSLIAGFNYLILGSIAAGFIVLGIGYLYIATGTLNMGELAVMLPAYYGHATVYAAFLFMMIGFSIKVAFFPLHLWLPDAYTEAPAAVTILIATATSKVTAYAMLRVIFSVFTLQYVTNSFPVTELVLIIAAVAIIAGAVLAIAQDNLKRMLAYSSISQMGYIMFALGVANQAALAGGILHIMAHAVMKGCLFMVAGMIIYRTGFTAIRQLSGLSRRMPVACAAFALAGASMIGIPPTIGFMSKYYLVLGAVVAGEYLAAAVLLAGSLLAAVYIWKVIEVMYFGDVHDEDLGGGLEAPVSMMVPVIILAASCLLLGIFVELPLEVVGPAAAMLLGGD
ncbi:MAG: monovalent cation/H+ antiporter subunit D family protein [Methanoregulaceae archaeon]|nr:monovalent cation/H+ antiporter subunit D family protein [Methanoregulaceae archaeon]